MEYRLETVKAKKLVGKHIRMSLSDNRTYSLWSSFMPRRKEITNAIGAGLFSMQVYDRSYDFENFAPTAEFDKWAAIEVTDFDAVPDGMETFSLEGGLYAVFIHKGPARDGPKTFGYIFGTWLPASGFSLDHRPHFEILGDKYKNNDPSSEEEVWIPVRKK